MKNWKLAMGSLALAGVLAAPGTTLAFGGGEGHHRYGFEHMARELQLTEGQRAQLKSNRESTREARMALRKQLKELRQQIHTAIERSAEQSTLDQFGAELGKLKVRQMQNRYQMRQQFEAILTDEQKAKLAELKDKRRENRQKLRGHSRGARNAGES
ncbi:Spy/CpxP family protein refolding chaperone [Microbulbifer sp. 2205BS26-8]|uniref:Spy/CpxP family protein refolding chaperone n=1 Tax=Microbulbifer sp. 2205BS26-8 TaxID=3064386 RepID=UPI00273E763B|nr:Spy/CpxP family protein refolding chaperone [Microbulbifer sp. 2205BS26-8]MDP5208969.1 Spy/CpxP family protein refolding chaperone [Microbulbifer sp. 2205BS26-8]